MNEHAVDAYGQDFHTQFLKLRVFLGDRRELGASNEREIPRLKAKEYPPAEILGELEIDELALVVPRRREIRGFPSDQDHFRFLLGLLLTFARLRRCPRHGSADWPGATGIQFFRHCSLVIFWSL